MEILAVENLSFSYPLSCKKVLNDISFSVNKGDFVVVCGATGSGKTTLLRLLKPQLAPAGEKQGKIFLFGKDIFEISGKETACKIGYVMQRPEQQIVADKVWHELAFGLENMGVPPSDIRRRVAEMACYFNIEDWFDKNTHELSGGQKQLLSLASVMVMQPDILLLDEPTAQLDPIAAADFLATVRKLNQDFSLTVLLIEHRLEEAVPLSEKMLVLNGGKLLTYDGTRNAVESLRKNADIFPALPAATRLFAHLDFSGRLPISLQEGRFLLEKALPHGAISCPAGSPVPNASEKALEFSHVFFRYQRQAPDILKDLTFAVNVGEIFCILGGNGSGKSTALSVAAALRKPYFGKIRIFGKQQREYKNQSLYKECLALLPQDVQTVFLKNTVREELQDAGITEEDLPFDLSSVLDQHPYDISGGQQQLVALAKALGQHPRLLLLDEPTKGLDAATRNRFIELLRRLKNSGITVVSVTHDVEFAALCADRCALFFRGEIISCDCPQAFFSNNTFYTTAACRMARGLCKNIATVEDLSQLIRQQEGGQSK